jgi:hypothetical protein
MFINCFCSRSALCVSICFYEGLSLLAHGLNRPISALCVSISFYEGESLLTHRLAPGLFCTPTTEAILKHFKKTIFFLVTWLKNSSCVSISFYKGVSLLSPWLNRPISALCVSISFYEGDFFLTHRLAPGLFCTPTTEAILKQLQQPFLWFFEATMTKGRCKGHSGHASKWWGASRSFSRLYVVCVSISSSPLSSLLTHQCLSV